MKYIIVMFTSRNDTMHFYSLIKKFNGFCSIINSPHSLSRSCGISVKISGNLINFARNIIANNRFTTFKGIYEISVVSNNDIATRLY